MGCNIFGAFLTLFPGSDLCRGDCRAGCCWRSPEEAQEGGAGSIPVCHGWGCQMVLLSELTALSWGLMPVKTGDFTLV